MSANKDFNSFRVIGNYEISEMCLLSFPCQHNVRNKVTDTTTRMTGDKIFTMLKTHGLNDSHFDCYEEYIRKRDNPTPEEIAEKLEREKKMQLQKEKNKLEYEERVRITNQYKASSRLDRLKAQNNVSV
jgi:hypothetical protein